MSEKEEAPLFGPSHLLLFSHPLRYQLIYRWLNKSGGNDFAVPIPITIIGNKSPIILDISCEFQNVFIQLSYLFMFTIRHFKIHLNKSE